MRHIGTERRIKKEIIIFGTGYKMTEELPYILSRGYKVRYFVDNNKEKIGRIYENCEVRSPLSLLEEDEEETIVISSENYKEEITAQLMDMGVFYKHNCLGLTEFELIISPQDFDCPTIERIKRDKEDISVFYDFQAFSMQINGGISRYFYEVISEMEKKKQVSVSFFQGINRSCYNVDGKNNGLVNYYSERTDIRNIEVLDLINANLIGKYTNIAEEFSIYHPTYYHDLNVGKYGKMILTVHDMIHEKYHLDSVTSFRKRKMVNKADGIIAISQSTKNDLMEIFGVNDKKIKVIHLANSLNFEIREDALIEEPYILFVGNRGGYKNGELLIKAYAGSNMKNELMLVFMGGGAPTPKEKELIESYGIVDSVAFCFGDDRKLANLYKYAKLFIYPSSYEGFGIPLLEAMHYGTPVITARSSSMTEVAGEAAVYFRPDSLDSLIYAINKLAGNKELREKYKERGFEREKQFSWKKCAEETYEYYCDMLRK